MKYNYCIFIGRFQPYHLGHHAVVIEALERANKLIIVLGSANVAPNIKNPFTVKNRIKLIRDALTEEQNNRVVFTEARDYLYDDVKWVNEIQAHVAQITESNSTIALIGYHKDNSSYYLDMFPEWDFIHAKPKQLLNATDIRNLYFQNKNYYELVPESVYNALESYQTTENYKTLCQEFNYINDYKDSWVNSPYTPSFNCVDAVVIQKNQVLVVIRDAMPGKGLYALPGGFINPKERVLDACLRELKEETNIIFPMDALKESLVEVKLFDHPDRSLRGRTFSHAHYFQLNEKVIPKVLGGDDAAKACWMSIIDIYKNENLMFEDHCQIVDYFVSKL